MVDVELRLIEPAQNRYRVYRLTECRTLFGELCLRVVWGRIGHRRHRERSEVFATGEARTARRDALLLRRERHGYVPSLASPGVERLAPARAAG
jgi:predicted DNA-binding WGR domain protein